MRDPTLEDILKVKCKPDRPFKCLPYGTCYSFDSFCDEDAGDVDSCFPLKVRDDASKLFRWCQDIQGNKSALSPPCQAACFHRFGASDLCPAPESSDVWFIAFIICAAFLVLSLTLIMVLLLKKRCTHKVEYSRMTSEEESHRVEMTESPGDQDKVAGPPPTNLKRQRSLNEEERDATAKIAGTTAKSNDNVASLTDSERLDSEGNPVGQQQSLGVTFRDCTDQTEDGRQGHNDQDRDASSSAGDNDESSRNSLGGSQSSSSSTRSVFGAEEDQRLGSSGSYASQASSETGLADVEDEKRRQRAHHAPETNTESSNQQTMLVTNLHSYESGLE